MGSVEEGDQSFPRFPLLIWLILALWLKAFSLVTSCHLASPEVQLVSRNLKPQLQFTLSL